MTFDDVKGRLSVAEVAQYYGHKANRAGFIRCPFHNDRTPSLKLYTTSYHCFACGAHGDVIDFVGRLYNLEPLEAVRRLNEDFSLGLQFDRAPPDPEAQRQRQREREAKQLFDEWKSEFLNMIDAAIRTGNNANFDNLTEGEVVAIQYKESMEYWSDLLMHGTDEQQMSVFDDRRGVERICKKALKNTLRTA